MKIDILAAAVALPDRELLARIHALAGNEREATAELVAHLAALELRPSLYLAEGYGSLFDYCTRALRLSEDAACNRIEAARATARFPVILEMLAAGALTLTSVRKLRSHLMPENHEAVLRKAAHRSKEQIEALIAELAPKPDVPAMVRKLPSLPTLLDPSDASALPKKRIGPPPEGSSTADAAGYGDRGPYHLQGSSPRVSPSAWPIVQALAPQRYRVQFTIGQDTHDRLRRVQSLLRRQIPDGDPAAIFDRALRLLEEVEGRKLGFAAKPGRCESRGGRNYENRIRSGTDKSACSARRTEGPSGSPEPTEGRSRHVPAAVKRAVWLRDAGQCAFVSNGGRRCLQRSFLELHHIRPYAMEGPATVGNIALRCRLHNQYEGELVFGPRRSVAPTPEDRVTKSTSNGPAEQRAT